MSQEVARHTGSTEPGDAAQGSSDSGVQARAGRTDAVSSGIVADKESSYRSELGKGKSVATAVFETAARQTPHSSEEDADAGDAAATNISRQTRTALQSGRNLRSAIAAMAAEELDESDEMDGTSTAYRSADDALEAARKSHARRSSDTQACAKADGQGVARHRQKGASGIGETGDPKDRAKADAARRKIQSRRTWAKARAAREGAGEATARTSGTRAARAATGRTLAATMSSAAAPVAGVLAGIVAFILAALVVSQLVSALFGFWENEDAKQAVAGLPPYITRSMVLSALRCQEEYGHPAGCTLAQIICESGQGDHLSGLATQDRNLFGIKWSESFSLAPEVTGHSSWQTGEEYDGQSVTVMAEFTSFTSYEDCIAFRSRVLLQSSRYAGNALIQQAIAEHDSNLMAEGLKDAGYATSSSYVDSLKSAMSTYNLYRFDGMTVEQFESMTSEGGGTIVEAAYSQLGVPYVWGGTTPGSGLDCSGLTQYCYAQAGISIPRNSEDQADAGSKIPLSEARPGDILWRSGHVAIYIGGDDYIHEPQSGDVCKVSSGISYFTCAIRFG